MLLVFSNFCLVLDEFMKNEEGKMVFKLFSFLVVLDKRIVLIFDVV